MTVQEVVLIEALTNDAIADFKRGAICAFQVEMDDACIYCTLTKFSPLLGPDKKPYAKSIIERKSIPVTSKLPFMRKQAHAYYRDTLKRQLEETFLTAMRENNQLTHPDEVKFIIRPKGDNT